MTETIDLPTRGDLPGALRDVTLLAPDAVVETIGHDDGCPSLGHGVGGGTRTSDDPVLARLCTCEIVEVTMSGPVPPEAVE